MEPWTTASGDEIEIADMTTSHLQNAVAWIDRNIGCLVYPGDHGDESIDLRQRPLCNSTLGKPTRRGDEC